MILNSDLHYLLWQGNAITHPVTLDPEVILAEPTLLVSSSNSRFLSPLYPQLQFPSLKYLPNSCQGDLCKNIYLFFGN